MALEPVEILKRLVAIPSVNPMGREVSGPEFYEHRLTAFLVETLAGLGIACERQPVAPLRENVIARLDGDPPVERGGRLILLEAHQDTVPVTGMTIAPFDPVVREGCLYGRGACDVKGGLAAMLAAFSRVAETSSRGRPTVALASTVNEENGFTGATQLCELFRAGGSSLIPRRPDAIIVAEPTELNVVVAHKGTVRWRCHVRGRAAHSSQPAAGDNAIYKMGRVLAALEEYQRDVSPRLGEHPLCGRPSLSVGTIQGGLSVNTVPDRCTIEIDRRLLPRETPDEAYRHVIEHLQSRKLGFAVEHDPPFMRSFGLSDEHNRDLAARLAETARGVTGRAELIGVPFGTNAAAFSAAGVPTVVFGPGAIEQAHTADEWIALDQLAAAAEVYYRFADGGF